MASRSPRPRVAFIVCKLPSPFGEGVRVQYVKRCTKSPVRTVVAEYTATPAEARLFSYNVARAVADRNACKMMRVELDAWRKHCRASTCVHGLPIDVPCEACEDMLPY